MQSGHQLAECRVGGGNRTIIRTARGRVRLAQVHPKKKRALRILAEPLGRACDHLVRGSLEQRAIFAGLNWPEACIINIEAAIEAGHETVSGVQQDGTHKGSGAVTARVKQVRKIREFRRKRSTQFAGVMGLRVGTRENGSVRHHGERGLRIRAFEDDALFGECIKMRRQPAMGVEKTHPVNSGGTKRHQNNVGLVRCRSGPWENGDTKILTKSREKWRHNIE